MRRNLAREVEAFAVRVLEHWVAGRGVVEDRSASHDPDFALHYSDGREAIGEIGWDEDKVLAAMWGETLKRDRHQVIELPTGLGQWSVSLVRGARINRLYDELPTVLADLHATGRIRLDIVGAWPRDLLAQRARHLGIEHLAQVGANEPAQAVFFMPASGGLMTGDPDIIVDWLENVGVAYPDLAGKLLDRDADERHIFVMSGSATPFDVDNSLQHVDERLPARAPNLGEGITHAWGVSRYGDAGGALWIKHEGWTHVPMPPR